MAFDTFHFFPNLPKEIQDLIWDAAVRPVPGTRHVHRFIVLGSQEPEHSFSSHLLDPAGLGVTYTKDDNLNEHKENDESSVDGGPNDSVYALDSGLWMTCKASRTAMERRFTKNEWWSVAEHENAPERLATYGDFNQEKEATHTASYKNCDGPNIAIEYDPSMFDQWLPGTTHFRRPDVEWNVMCLSFMMELLHHHARRTIWFIDYRLKPIDPDYASREVLSGESVLRSSDGQERAIFHSNELVYIETKPDDRDKWYIDTSGYQSRGTMEAPSLRCRGSLGRSPLALPRDSLAERRSTPQGSAGQCRSRYTKDAGQGRG
ncbi:hypothetical protein BHE90_011486 [Fusarium euwallaceae]|uniref:2EXR domain-containing protein n=1 Tax=Fusarium euwallaceae TaxID=1147111 RepID=A0A430LEC4_9HYPO|nr:hypothetical protein BHE90_011486 [Fusarium euwallaceae]